MEKFSLHESKELANQLLQQNKIEEATIIFQKLIQEYPDKIQGYQGLAQIANRQKNWDLALKLWDEASIKFPNNINFKYQKANALFQDNKYPESQIFFQELKDKYPEKHHGYEGLAKIANRQKNWDLAFRLWEELNNKFPDNINFKYQKGNVLVKLEKYTEAHKIFQELRDKYPEKHHGYQGLAQIANGQQNWNLALNLWGEMTIKFPDNILFWQNKGNALLNLQRLDEAENIFQFMIEKYPYNFQGYENLAKLFYKTTQHKKGLEYIKKAYDLKPNQLSVINNYVIFLENLGKIDKVEKLLKQGLNININITLEKIVYFYSQYNKYKKILELYNGYYSYFKDNAIFVNTARSEAFVWMTTLSVNESFHQA